MAAVLTTQQKMAFMVMESQAKQKTSLDIFNEFTSMGLPVEAISALKEVALKKANDIGGKVIEVGKIIVTKIIDFIKENPAMSIGVALGAAVGALAGFIPFIGPFIAPLTTMLGAGVGALIGNSIGRAQNMDEAIDNAADIATPKGLLKEAMRVAVKFFNLLKEIFTVIFKKEALQ